MSPTWHCSHSMSVLAKADGAARDPVAAEIEWLTQELTYVERRLTRVKNSLIFRLLRAIGSQARMLKQTILVTGPYPAQTRAGATNAHGSYLGCLAAKRKLG